MTDKEAIEVLKNIKARFETDEGMQDDIKALDKAIEALKNQKSIIDELEEIKTELDKEDDSLSICDHEYEYGCHHGLEKAMDNIDKHIAELKGE